MKRSAGKSRRKKVRNVKLKEMMRVAVEPDVRGTIQKEQLCWHGYVQQILDERLPKRKDGLGTYGKQQKRSTKK
jgi:hypothetical protein